MNTTKKSKFYANKVKIANVTTKDSSIGILINDRSFS